MDHDAVLERADRLMAGSRAHADRETGYVLHHGLRVAREAIRLNRAMALGADEDLLWAAGLFHDVGKGLEPHWKSGEVLVRLHLADLADSPDQLDKIAHLVRFHAKRSDPAVYTPELKLIQDADILDHRGSLGVLVAAGSAQRRDLAPESLAEEWKDHAARRAEFAGMLHYEESRRVYALRLRKEEAFFRELQDELTGEEKNDG